MYDLRHCNWYRAPHWFLAPSQQRDVLVHMFSRGSVRMTTEENSWILPSVRVFIESLPPKIAVYIFDLEGNVILANASAIDLWRDTPASLTNNLTFNTLTNPESVKRGMAEYFQRTLRGEPVEPMHLTHQRRNAAGESIGEVNVELTQSPIYDEHGTLTHICRIYHDITDETEQKHKLDQQAQELAQAEANQAWLLSTIKELSTPVLPIYDGVLVAPLIGSIDTQRSMQLIETLLTSIQRYHAQIVLLDITGVPLVDTVVAARLLQAADAAQLLGAQVVLVGTRPEVAETIVQLGVDLGRMLAQPDLQAGLNYAFKQLQLRIAGQSTI